jgi:hypothetical protein
MDKISDIRSFGHSQENPILSITRPEVWRCSCGIGNFGVAQSPNGTHFTIISLNQTGVYPLVDGNALFVDDDNTAYVLPFIVPCHESLSSVMCLPALGAVKPLVTQSNPRHVARSPLYIFIS